MYRDGARPTLQPTFRAPVLSPTRTTSWRDPSRRTGYSPPHLTRCIVPAMKKRALSAVLWFYTGWYAGAMIAHTLGLSIALGPIVGFAAAALIAGDPRGIIWSRSTSTKLRTEPA